VAAHGIFGCAAAGCYTVTPEGKSATAFLFELIARLQDIATVPRRRIEKASNTRAGESAMIVTASVLYDFVQCPRVALDAFGNAADRDAINPFVRLLWERGTLFERETIAKLQLPFVDLSKAPDADRERLKLEAMARGEPLIHCGRISAGDLLGMPDLLRKETGGYVPGDIKSGRGEEGGGDDHHGKPKLHYAVQLALYVDILERSNRSGGTACLRLGATAYMPPRMLDEAELSFQRRGQRRVVQS
jgi:hypothetical protein